ncbi:MAG TPA: glycosyltransferase [Thermoanaerobaculia bacterium]
MRDDTAPQTVGVVVTNYETWDLTRRCLDRVAAHGAGVSDVLVVDDASASPVPADLKARIRVNPHNLGLVRSLNLGIREVAGDVIVLFDSDAHPLTDFATPALRRFATDPRLGILGFATVDGAGRPTGSSEPEPGVASLVLGQRLHARVARWLPQGPLCVFTCAMAVRRTTFAELGGFDEDFDWLDLDLDLSIRARRAGWTVAAAPEIVAFHRGSGAPQATSQRVVRFHKTRWLLLRKAGTIRRPRLVRALVLTRLRLEILILRLAGAFHARSPEELADKLAGRRAALRWGAEHYR